MFLKIVLHLTRQEVQESQILYFDKNLPQISIKDAEKIINKLDLAILSKATIRFQNILKNNETVGMVVSVVANS
jgi:hypothetical protein